MAIVPQNLYEFWVVATRPVEQNGLGMSVKQASAALEDIKLGFRLLIDERLVFQQWERLVVEYEVLGKKAHDARLVAAMMRHGLSHLVTFNTKDFVRYRAITAVAPASVISPTAPR